MSSGAKPQLSYIVTSLQSSSRTNAVRKGRRRETAPMKLLSTYFDKKKKKLFKEKRETVGLPLPPHSTQ